MPASSKSPELVETGSLALGHSTSVTSVPVTIKPLADLVKWGGRNDSRLVLSEAAVKKVSRKTLSPSTAEAMNGCSAKWVMERLLPRHEDPFGAAELGSSGHRVFEKTFDLPAEERTVQAAMAMIATLQDDTEGKLAIPSNPADLDRWHSNVAKLVTGLWVIENPREIEIVGSEIEMKNVKLGDVPFGGYIDRVAFKNGVLTTSDYKTGKPGNLRFGDKHGDQLRMYNMALANSPGFDKPEAAEVLYTQFEELRVVDVSPAAMDATLEKFEKAWITLNKQVDASSFATKVTALCGWCPAVDVCPAAKAEGKVAKREFDIAGEALGIGETRERVESPTVASGQLFEGRGTALSESNEQKVDTDMYEPKPWEETNEDGSLNLNSYAATAAFGIVEIAVEALHANGQQITATNVRAFSQTLEAILNDVFRTLGDGEPSFAAGRHTRLRGALHTTLDTIPAPFGGDAEAWEIWVKKAIVRTKAIAKTAVALWEGEDRVAEPWLVLATTAKTVDEFADAS